MKAFNNILGGMLRFTSVNPFGYEHNRVRDHWVLGIWELKDWNKKQYIV